MALRRGDAMKTTSFFVRLLAVAVMALCAGCVSFDANLGLGLEADVAVGGLAEVGLGYGETELANLVSFQPWRTRFPKLQERTRTDIGMLAMTLHSTQIGARSAVFEHESAWALLPGLLSEYDLNAYGPGSSSTGSSGEPYHHWHRWMDIEVGAWLGFLNIRMGICPSVIPAWILASDES